MRGNEFLDKMDLTDPAYVEAADAAPKRKKNNWLKWTGAAACIVVAVCAGTRFWLQGAPNNPAQLPMLTISENASEGMGFEGYMAYNISELVNANPWSEETTISALPVYKNPLTYDENYIASGADFDKMREILLKAADGLGLDTDALTVIDDTPDEETQKAITEKFQSVGEKVPNGYFDPSKLIIETDGMKIEVDKALTVKISFEPAISLPDEYHFADNSSYEDMSAAAEYLKDQYQDFIGMDNPKVNIHGGDYDINLLQMYSLEFFDAKGGITEQILNYNFNRAAFYCDSEGKLFLARLFQPDLSNKAGEYPIVTTEEAGELLSKGNYITTVPCEMPGMEYVKKVELIYRTGGHEEYIMPYYRFYVELPEMERDGLKTYGAYYVPAVAGEYISNMPTWDGSFN